MGLGLLSWACTLRSRELRQSWEPFLHSGSTLCFRYKAWVLLWWTSNRSALQSPLSHTLFPLLMCLQTSLVWTYRPAMVQLCWTAQSNQQSYISMVQLVIFSIWAVNSNNKLGCKFLSWLCGMSLTLLTLQTAHGFSGLHCSGDSYVSNAPPESFTCFVPTTQAHSCKKVMGFIYFGHGFALSRGDFHPFCCSVILRDTSLKPAIPFHLHSSGDTKFQTKCSCFFCWGHTWTH